MKALTIRQPWASLIALGVKTIETRSWQTRYRGPIAIHAGARPARNGPGPWRIHSDGRAMWNYARPHDPVVTLPLGAIVATATLVDVVPMIDPDDEDFEGPNRIEVWPGSLVEYREQPGGWVDHYSVSDQLPYGDFAPGRYAWILEDVVPCDPVPAKGKQGLWTWDEAGEGQP